MNARQFSQIDKAWAAALKETVEAANDAVYAETTENEVGSTCDKLVMHDGAPQHSSLGGRSCR